LNYSGVSGADSHMQLKIHVWLLPPPELTCQ